MVLCKNCHCEIEDNKIILHERFCIQNIKFCEECKEGILKDEYEEHCLSHKNKEKEQEKEKKEEKGQEKEQNKEQEKDKKEDLSNELSNLQLSKEASDKIMKKVLSSKIGCQFCGQLFGYEELEDHEVKCDSRIIVCSLCKSSMANKDLEAHIFSVHGNLIENSERNDLCLDRMTSEEQIQYAINLSKQEMIKNNQIDNQKEKINVKEYTNKKEELNINKKTSSEDNTNLNLLPKNNSYKFDYDEIDNEYEREIYEEEMKNFGEDEDNKDNNNNNN